MNKNTNNSIENVKPLKTEMREARPVKVRPTEYQFHLGYECGVGKWHYVLAKDVVECINGILYLRWKESLPTTEIVWSFPFSPRKVKPEIMANILGEKESNQDRMNGKVAMTSDGVIVIIPASVDDWLSYAVKNNLFIPAGLADDLINAVETKLRKETLKEMAENSHTLTKKVMFKIAAVLSF